MKFLQEIVVKNIAIIPSQLYLHIIKTIKNNRLHFEKYYKTNMFPLNARI